MVGPMVVPLPPGIDMTTMEALEKTVHLFEPRHFAVPFLAHSLGTLAGAYLAFILAATRRFPIAALVGAAFFAGGVAASSMIPVPVWFIVLDLVVAYFPMAYLGARLGVGTR